MSRELSKGSGAGSAVRIHLNERTDVNEQATLNAETNLRGAVDVSQTSRSRCQIGDTAAADDAKAMLSMIGPDASARAVDAKENVVSQDAPPIVPTSHPNGKT